MFRSTSGVITRNHKTPELPQFKPVTWKKKISHFTFLSEFPLKIEHVMLMLINPSHQWPRQDFSLQYWNNIEPKHDENKGRYQ